MKALRKFATIGLVSVVSAFSGFAEDKPKQICVSEAFTARSDFQAGRINGCEFTNENTVRIEIKPEDKAVTNPSPWYSFRIEPHSTDPISIELVYRNAKHRYWPKISQDSINWHPLKVGAVNQLNDHVLRISLPAIDEPIYISGQEVLTDAAHQQWLDELASTSGTSKTLLGKSMAGRDIYKLETAPENGSGNYIFLVGRQHPPEVTGALALMPFAEAIYADTPLAKAFRKKFGVIIVPILNPDGVANGHWRHNMGEKDLNRDWGPFTQPETQLMRDELERFKEEETLSLFLDFHSTRRNVLYTQAEDEETKPRGYTKSWVERVKGRVSNYTFERAERPLTSLPTSKNYVYSTFGVPAITYEVGDETDRQALKIAATVFAEEMMEVLLNGNKD
ncbi:MAG: M14-type cytosolic carboxypeptidase [Kordiimonas sp.]